MDRIEYDVMEAERLGYGIHYGHYKADHPISDWNPEIAERPKQIQP